MRAVLDTNVIVSGLLKPGGNEAAVLGLVAEGRIVLCANPAILAEYEDVLSRRRLGLDPVQVRRFLAGAQGATVR